MQVDYCPRDIPPPIDEEASAENGAAAQQSQQASESVGIAQKVPPATANGVPTVLAAPAETPVQQQQPVPIEVMGSSGEIGNQGGAQPPAIMPPSQQQQQQPQLQVNNSLCLKSF